MPKVSIIFPNYNGKSDSLTCLRSLSLLSYPQQNIETIMVDNTSTDGSIEAVKKHFPSVEIIPLKKNIGFAAAVNEGIRISIGDYIFIINNDIIFDKEFLTVLIDYMEKNLEVGIAGGKIYYQAPKNKILFCGAKFNPWLGSIHRLPNPNRIKESEWIQGCAMLIKRAVIEKVGLFDEGFFFGFEDFDLCRRAKRAGFKIIYHPRAIAWHKEGATIDKEGFIKKNVELYKGKFRFVFKNSSLPQILSTILFQFFFVPLYRKIIVRDKYFAFTPILIGFFDSLKKLPEIKREIE